MKKVIYKKSNCHPERSEGSVLNRFFVAILAPQNDIATSIIKNKWIRILFILIFAFLIVSCGPKIIKQKELYGNWKFVVKEDEEEFFKEYVTLVWSFSENDLNIKAQLNVNDKTNVVAEITTKYRFIKEEDGSQYILIEPFNQDDLSKVKLSDEKLEVKNIKNKLCFNTYKEKGFCLERAR